MTNQSPVSSPNDPRLVGPHVARLDEGNSTQLFIASSKVWRLVSGSTGCKIPDGLNPGLATGSVVVYNQFRKPGQPELDVSFGTSMVMHWAKRVRATRRDLKRQHNVLTELFN